ncbi:MAG: Gfo/Idh/MocA family oxidoreductase [Oscillospiraceae bacterium]|nr:Gfo/Idh/MocA family oxidoreductase [Oscillospiraceae bacterium]
MLFNNENVLIIGGLGHWSQKAYIPAFKKEKFIDNIIICDILDAEHCPDGYIYYKLSKESDNKNIETVKDIINNHLVDVVVIATPPLFHHVYLKGLLDANVDFICDKPLVAIEGQSQNVESAKKILQEYNDIQEKRNSTINSKTNRKPLIYSPLRRITQAYYKLMYNGVKEVNETFDQNITQIYMYENDGCYRWNNEMEIEFTHGYGKGLGKLTHTGYHSLGILAELINNGCKNVKSLKCSCLDTRLIGDNYNNKSVRNLQKLLEVEDEYYEMKEITKSAEFDISLKYTIQFTDDIDTCAYIYSKHSGVSNRTVKQYDKINTGDQGRTDDSQFLIEQGPFQNIYGLVFADSSMKGSAGNSYLKIKRHELVAQKLGKDMVDMISVNNQDEKTTHEIVIDIVKAMSGQEEFMQEYSFVEFDAQKLTMELYVAALISKITNEEIKWIPGELYDSLS